MRVKVRLKHIVNDTKERQAEAMSHEGQFSDLEREDSGSVCDHCGRGMWPLWARNLQSQGEMFTWSMLCTPNHYTPPSKQPPICFQGLHTPWKQPVLLLGVLPKFERVGICGLMEKLKCPHTCTWSSSEGGMELGVENEESRILNSDMVIQVVINTAIS